MSEWQALLEQARQDMQQQLRRIDEALSWLTRSTSTSPSISRAPEFQPKRVKAANAKAQRETGSELEFSIAEIDSMLRHKAFPRYLLSSRRLPVNVGQMSVSSLRLKPRTLHCIAALDGDRPQKAADLSRLPIRRLMEIPHFGMVSLLDLLGKLRPFVQDPATQRQQISPTLSRMLLQFSESSRAQRISCQDPRFQDVLSSLLAIASASGAAVPPHETAAELAVRLSRSPLSSREEVQVWARIRNLRKAIDDASRQPLETELLSMLISAFDQRTAQLILRVYGFDGQGGTTLQQAGDEFHLTRERVRQICRRVETLRSTRLFLPTLEECAKVMAARVTAEDAEIERLLQARKLTARPFQVAGVRNAIGTLLAEKLSGIVGWHAA